MQHKTCTAEPQATTAVVTTPPVITPEVTITKASVTTSVILAYQIAKPNPPMKKVVAKAPKTKTPAATDVKTHLFMKAQKNQTKVAVCHLLDTMKEESDSYLANEAQPELEQNTEVTEVTELATLLETYF